MPFMLAESVMIAAFPGPQMRSIPAHFVKPLDPPATSLDFGVSPNLGVWKG